MIGLAGTRPALMHVKTHAVVLPEMRFLFRSIT